MLNQKQIGCSNFLCINFNDPQVSKGETSKKTTIHNRGKFTGSTDVGKLY